MNGTLPGDLEKYREVRNWLVTQKSALNGGREVSLEPPDTSQLNKECKESFELALDGLRAYEWAGQELENHKDLSIEEPVTLDDLPDPRRPGRYFTPPPNYEEDLKKLQEKANKKQDFALDKVKRAISKIESAMFIYQVIHTLTFFVILIAIILGVGKFI